MRLTKAVGFCLLVILFLFATFDAVQAADRTRPQGAYTPAKESPERIEILNVLRKMVYQNVKPKVVFVVHHFKIHGNWAWVVASPQSEDGTSKYETIAVLVQEIKGRWQLADIPCIDMEDPECAREIEKRFPGVPKDIF